MTYKISKIFLIISLIISPILLGGNRYGFELISLTLTIFALGFFIHSGNMTKLFSDLNKNTRNIFIFLFVIIPAWMVLQATSLTPDFLNHPLWQELGIDGAISLNPGLTWSALMGYMSLSIVLIGVYMAMYDVKAAIQMQFICLMIINAIALFGLVVFLFDLQTYGIIDSTRSLKWINGTFVYKNAMANFIGFGIIICMSYLAEMLLLKRIRFAKLPLSTQAFLISINLVFLAILQILTASRGGIMSTLIAVTFLVLLVMLAKKSRKKKNSLSNGVKIIVILLVLFAAFAALYYLAQFRGSNSSIHSTQVRLALIADSIIAVLDRPLLGHGAGAYIDLEPLYHYANGVDRIFWNKLHSTPMEIMVTLGIPIFLIIYYFVAAIFIRLVNRCLTSNSNWILTIPAATIIVEMLVHGVFDFTIQVPAISLYAFFLVSLSFNQKFRRKNPPLSAE
ncbi:MAG: O-antigen ligase family protein [Alphaproteobacteria bacterium]|nr:O-antigen ligase family protein [Alphaproteobacteria bacterium]